MYARVSEFRVPSENLAGFTEAAQSILPLIRKESGFRAVLVLKGEGSPVLVRVVSVWQSYEHLKASERSMFLYQALSRVMAFSKGFPIIEENEVMVGELAASEKGTMAVQ
jgi:quinol monooxygenase YgiN